MNLFEYAIARTVNALLIESGKRDLEQQEWTLLDLLTPSILRYEQREEEQRLVSPRPPRRRRAGGAVAGYRR
jgi:hypothetical protein